MVSDGNAVVDPELIPVGATVPVRSADGTDPLAFVGEWHSTSPTLLAVTVDRSIQLFLAEWRTSTDAAPAQAGLVSVGERLRSAAEHAGSSGGCGDAIRTVADPADLDAVVDHVRSLLDGWRDQKEPTIVVVDSVTGLLDVAPKSAVAGFVAELADLVSEAGAVGFLAIRCQADHSIEDLLTDCAATIEATPDGWRPVEAPPRTSLSTDELFSVLADDRRRQILQYLADHDRTTVTDIVDSIAVEADASTRARIAVSLVHTHLPKLADAGVLEYDERTKSVVATPIIDRFQPVLELVDSTSGE